MAFFKNLFNNNKKAVDNESDNGSVISATNDPKLSSSPSSSRSVQSQYSERRDNGQKPFHLESRYRNTSAWNNTFQKSKLNASMIKPTSMPTIVSTKP
jgi:hypothetical protein